MTDTKPALGPPSGAMLREECEDFEGQIDVPAHHSLVNTKARPGGPGGPGRARSQYRQ